MNFCSYSMKWWTIHVRLWWQKENNIASQKPIHTHSYIDLAFDLSTAVRIESYFLFRITFKMTNRYTLANDLRYTQHWRGTKKSVYINNIKQSEMYTAEKLDSFWCIHTYIAVFKWSINTVCWWQECNNEVDLTAITNTFHMR